MTGRNYIHLELDKMEKVNTRFFLTLWKSKFKQNSINDYNKKIILIKNKKSMKFLFKNAKISNCFVKLLLIKN